MTKPPLVSVILPFFNAELTLGRAIQSIVNQSYKNLELILVDNNSKDQSRRIAQDYVQKDSRIKLFEEQRQGVTFAANKGLEAALGIYIARMDADDISYPDRLVKQVQRLESDVSVDLVSGKVKYVGDPSNGGFIRYVNWLNQINTSEEIQTNQFVEYPIVNPSILMRRELFEKYGGYEDGNFPEDYEYFLRLQENGIRMEKVDSVVLEWIDSPQRLTRNDSKYSHEAFFRIKAKYLSEWLKKNNPSWPDVMIWGGGKLSRKRSGYLTEHGINILNYIDIIDSERKDIINYKQIDQFKKSFILSYVSNVGAREEIRNYLNGNGFIELSDYMICA